jgi:hypothetical protein
LKNTFCGSCCRTVPSWSGYSPVVSAAVNHAANVLLPSPLFPTTRQTCRFGMNRVIVHSISRCSSSEARVYLLLVIAVPIDCICPRPRHARLVRVAGRAVEYRSTVPTLAEYAQIPREGLPPPTAVRAELLYVLMLPDLGRAARKESEYEASASLELTARRTRKPNRREEERGGTMRAYANRPGLLIAMATCIVALSVPAAARAASDSTTAGAATRREITRCRIRAGEPLRDGGQYIYGARIRCHGSVTLHVVTKLQERSGGRWHVYAKRDWGRVGVRHHDYFGFYKGCRHGGTFRSMGIMTRGSRSETDVSDGVRLHCPS